ncbi:hypothetical protein BDL97_01G031300 [Sphagnum fallax]|jgi:tellurite resistance-related uncharacterized protein|nr:hypothetical protein BDL97_01G031300 [Sphagnum fallax]
MAGGMGSIAVASGTRQATTLVQFSQMRGDWVSSMKGEGGSGLELFRELRLRSTPLATRPTRPQTVMKNINEGKGVFAPLVVLTRSIVGTKRFNQLRGKGIALHSQVITEFCKTIGADAKQRQGLIRLAKKNGEKLGFLA